MRANALRLLLAAALSFPAGLLSAAADPVTQTGYPPFVIGPGDMLNITVYGDKGLPSAYLVDSAGTIDFPLIGELQLSGLTQAQAAKKLAGAYALYEKDPQVTVLVSESAQYNISILGNVVRPGKYGIRGLPNLLSAIAEAGGPLPHSALNSTVLVRGQQHSTLRLGDYLSDPSSPLKPQPLLYPGDVIYVPQSPWPTLGDWGIVVGLVTSALLLSSAFKNR